MSLDWNCWQTSAISTDNKFAVILACFSLVCGAFKKKKEDKETSLGKEVIENAEEGRCTAVVISDKFVLTAAHCLEEAADR